MLRHDVTFTVNGFDADAFGALSLPALSGYLEEAAARHAVLLGCGLDTLAARGLTWVLLRQRIEVPAPVRRGDTLRVATWPSGVERLLVSREFSVAAADGAQVARASTVWLVLDLEKRRPVRPGDVLDPAIRPVLEKLAPVPEALPAPGEGAEERRFDVRYADIDRNLHVNNASYLGWALEAVDEATWRARRARAAEVHFLAEGRLGDGILVRTGGGEGERAHAVLRAADGKELARVTTRWVEREPRPDPLGSR